MASTQAQLLMMFLWAIAVGNGMAVLYDLLYLSRLLLFGTHVHQKADPFKGNGIAKGILFLEDILFGIVCGIAMILLLYYTNDGQFRAWALLGVVIGYVLNVVTVRPLLRRVFCLVARVMRKVIAWALYKVLWPFGQLWRLLDRTVARYLKKTYRERQERRAKIDTDRYIQGYIQHASQGFGLTMDFRDTEKENHL